MLYHSILEGVWIAAMNINAENIFSLNVPDAYDCFVERYHANFQVIRLRAESFTPQPPPAENSIEFVFTGVLYFEGAMNWTGANICIASRRECYELLIRAKLLDNSHPHYSNNIVWLTIIFHEL